MNNSKILLVALSASIPLNRGTVVPGKVATRASVSSGSDMTCQGLYSDTTGTVRLRPSLYHFGDP